MRHGFHKFWLVRFWLPRYNQLHYVNNVLFGSSQYSGNVDSNLLLLERANHNSHFEGKLYSCNIYDNTIIIRNLVPCYRKADSVAGLYDLVNNTFYTNQGTGEFTVGPDIN